ncbi:hypothetical protein A2Y85_02950 [candidate division WOR-3 bacterium RBG_13_43_14]|uniref:carboxypeptidase T n=1 Tax=candidate division WOR-3 bacterium RBG_13_43_14 TaxID=1802590 RepID=A0A1F4UFE0_UNCW3|nr:MAG: hypothetical protein A2Y85_02950 [candidate division WOR-3 bacterium RBG_13_43_14]
MKKLFIVLIIMFISLSAQDMIVRVYADWHDLVRIDPKYNFDIAAGKSSEWFDIVVDHHDLSQITASGLPFEVTVSSLEYQKELVRGTYLSYAQINDSLRHLATNYPVICKFDSLPIRTYENRWIYGVKISDNVSIEENEPGFSIDGCHHSREWATPQAVLFFADSMLRSYASVPEIAEIINTTQIFCFPLINVDGYVYDYPGQLSWRKNREPFGGGIGADPNRNYGGSINGEIAGYWGAADEGQVSHNPATSSQIFCGQSAFSGDEIHAYTTYIRQHKITTGFSLHSYGEQVMWAWGYKAQGTSDSLLYNQKGIYMASLMQRLSGGGTYTPGQSYSNPYPTCGNTRDWVYGYNKYVAGLSALFYGSEIGTAFYQPQGDLDNISRQVFKAAKYLSGFADSLILVAEGFVPPSSIYALGSVGQNFTIGWYAYNTYDNHPVRWELVELSNSGVITDNLESGTTRWILEGFTLSTTQSHSSSHSFFSGNTSNMNTAVRTAHPYIVQAGDSLTFWCWHNLETNYDVAVAEISVNTKEWFCLADRYNGNSSGWIKKAISLTGWVGQSVYFRFRAMSDESQNNGGFYVDDIYPVNYFNTVSTVSSNITDTLYQFTDHPVGQYYFYVRGNNNACGWGDFSQLEQVDVIVGINESPEPFKVTGKPSLIIQPNPSVDHTEIILNNFAIHGDRTASLAIYDVSGRIIQKLQVQLDDHGSGSMTWSGQDKQGRAVPSGIYFVMINTDSVQVVEQIIMSR